MSRTREKTKFNPFTPLHSLDFLRWYLFSSSWRCYHLSCFNTKKILIPILSISNLISLYTFQRFRNRSLFSSSFLAFSPFLGVQLTKRPEIVYFPIREEIFCRHVWLYWPRVIASIYWTLRSQLLNSVALWFVWRISSQRLLSAFSLLFLSQPFKKSAEKARERKISEGIGSRKSDFIYLLPSIKWLFLCLINRKANGVSWEWKTRE